MWEILRADHPDVGEPMPYVCGVVSNGVWFDMGSAKEVWKNFTASLSGLKVSVALGFKLMIRSTLRSPVPSVEATVDDDLDIPKNQNPLSHLVNAWIGGHYPWPRSWKTAE